MSTFFERVVNEQSELQTKISGLDSFIKSEKYNEVFIYGLLKQNYDKGRINKRT